MKKVAASLLLTLIAVPGIAQVKSEVPQLVVGITVDQMRSDYIYALQQLFGEKGFKRVMRNVDTNKARAERVASVPLPMNCSSRNMLLSERVKVSNTSSDTIPL